MDIIFVYVLKSIIYVHWFWLTIEGSIIDVWDLLLCLLTLATLLKSIKKLYVSVSYNSDLPPPDKVKAIGIILCTGICFSTNVCMLLYV